MSLRSLSCQSNLDRFSQVLVRLSESLWPISKNLAPGSLEQPQRLADPKKCLKRSKELPRNPSKRSQAKRIGIQRSHGISVNALAVALRLGRSSIWPAMAVYMLQGTLRWFPGASGTIEAAPGGIAHAHMLLVVTT